MNTLRKAYKEYDGKVRAAMGAIDEFANLSNWQRTEIATRLLYIFVPSQDEHRRTLLIALEKVIIARYPEEKYYEYRRRGLLSNLDTIGDIPF